LFKITNLKIIYFKITQSSNLLLVWRSRFPSVGSDNNQKPINQSYSCPWLIPSAEGLMDHNSGQLLYAYTNKLLQQWPSHNNKDRNHLCIFWTLWYCSIWYYGIRLHFRLAWSDIRNSKVGFYVYFFCIIYVRVFFVVLSVEVLLLRFWLFGEIVTTAKLVFYVYFWVYNLCRSVFCLTSASV